MDDDNTLEARVAQYRRENSKVCPRCGVRWFKTTEQCNCGFNFNTQMRAELPSHWVWPTIRDLKTARRAATNGAQAAFFVSGVTGLFALLSILNVSNVIDPSALGDAVLAAFLGFMIRRMSRIAAVAALATFVVERVYAGIVHGVGAGIGVLAIILLLAFISGVRGTFAYHRYRQRIERTPGEKM